MSQTSSRLALPYLQPAQAQKHVTHNSALEILDAVTQLTVASIGLNTPPATSVEGDVYVVGNAPVDVWATAANQLAVWSNGGWIFVTPREGWQLWDLDTQTRWVLSDGTWSATDVDLQNIEGVGIGTTSDQTNRLAVAAPAVLLTHDTTSGGHQLKINKQDESDTASLLFQTNWSGRAEMGTTGSDDFAIKVSGDGASFTTALAFDGTTGLVTGAAVQSDAQDATPGRLMRADFGYSPANIVGTVGEASGVPTGAVIESARTAQGDYVRYADGTQICADALTLTYAGSNRIEAVWVFPVPFFGSPQAITSSINANSLLANATPGPDELGGAVHSNTTSTQAKILQYRIEGLTDFTASDTASCRVMAVGRWM